MQSRHLCYASTRILVLCDLVVRHVKHSADYGFLGVTSTVKGRTNFNSKLPLGHGEALAQNVLVLPSTSISSRVNGWCLKRTMSEKNGESTPRGLCLYSLVLDSNSLLSTTSNCETSARGQSAYVRVAPLAKAPRRGSHLNQQHLDPQVERLE